MNQALDAVSTELYRWAREAHEAKCQRNAESGRCADDGDGEPLVVESVAQVSGRGRPLPIFAPVMLEALGRQA